LYGSLCEAYESGPYQKLAAWYTDRFAGRKETEESKAALENIFRVVDRVIDSYARAVALGENHLRQKEWRDSLRVWYKFRHNDSDAGIDELIAEIMSAPFPVEPLKVHTSP
jgi:hypothetical protein